MFWFTSCWTLETSLYGIISTKMQQGEQVQQLLYVMYVHYCLFSCTLMNLLTVFLLNEPYKHYALTDSLNLLRDWLYT